MVCFKYILLLCFIVKISFSLVAYDCFHDRSNITAVSLLNVGPCTSPLDIKAITKLNMIQLVSTRLYDNIKVFHCSIDIIKTIFYCGMHNHVSIVDRGISSYLEVVSRDECLAIHNGNKIKIEGMETIVVKGNSTTAHQFNLVGTVDSYGNCDGKTYMYNSNNYYKAIVQISMKVSIKDYYTSLDLSTNSITFNDGTTCKSNSVNCIHPNYGYSFWTVGNLLECKSNNKDVIFEGYANVTSYNGNIVKGSIISVHKDEQIFKIILGNKLKLCDQLAFETEEKRLFIVPKVMDEYFFNKKKIDVKNIDFTSHLNYKISYVFDHISNKLDEVYKSLTSQACELERKTLYNKIRLARNHPHTLGNIITNEPGYMSVIAGEVLHIIQCQMVEVNLRKTISCYNNIPIIYMNQSLYLEPFSKIITNSSDEVHCSPITPVMYNFDGYWYSLTPQAVKVLEPIILTPEIRPSSLNFSSVNSLLKSGIYDKEAMDNYKAFMLFPMVKFEANNYIAAKGTGSNIYQNHELNNHLILDVKSLKQQAHEAISEFFGWTETFGAYMGALLGIGMIYKILTKICSTMLNGATLYSAFGCGFHLLASLMTSMTHLIFQKKQPRTHDSDVELGEINVPHHREDLEEEDINISFLYPRLNNKDKHLQSPSSNEY